MSEGLNACHPPSLHSFYLQDVVVNVYNTLTYKSTYKATYFTDAYIKLNEL